MNLVVELVATVCAASDADHDSYRMIDICAEGRRLSCGCSQEHKTKLVE